MKIRIITIIITGLALAAMLLGGCSKSSENATSTIYDIKKGEFDIVVSSDGNLNTPNTYNLAFGTNGIISDILVNEGDQVNAGAMLAFLDDTSEVNGVETALYNLQNTVNTQNVSGGSVNCNVVVPYSYPDMSSQLIFEEAQKDMDSCLAYYQAGRLQGRRLPARPDLFRYRRLLGPDRLTHQQPAIRRHADHFTLFRQ